MTTWLLVPSPLLGPVSWAPVAAVLAAAGDRAVVPDLRPALAGAGGFAVAQAGLAAAAVPSGAVVLVGHSGAGPLLPSVAAALAQRGATVVASVFVDAGLPHPGRSRRSTLPAELAGQLDALTADGWLPPWPSWWPAAALAELVPDPALRAALERDCPALPAALFDEPLPDVVAGLGAVSYLRLSAAYDPDAARAREQGWPVRTFDTDHLAPLTRPADIAARLQTATGGQ